MAKKTIPNKKQATESASKEKKRKKTLSEAQKKVLAKGANVRILALSLMKKSGIETRTVSKMKLPEAMKRASAILKKGMA